MQSPYASNQSSECNLKHPAADIVSVDPDNMSVCS